LSGEAAAACKKQNDGMCPFRLDRRHVDNIWRVPRGISISPAVHRAGNPIISFYSLHYMNIFRSNRIFGFCFGIEVR
jgi:hypothetical protein